MRTFTAKRGSVIVMVTLALFVMCGIMGLAVDLGWAFFVKKNAQAAADAAALAAAQDAYDRVGQLGSYVCGADIACQDSAPCTGAGANLLVGCQYAQRNGFADSGLQHVQIAAGTSSPAPTVPGVNVDYWVAVRASQGISTLFSAVMGNTSMTSASRATAAVITLPVRVSLFLMDRRLDYAPWGHGVDLEAGGGGGGGNNTTGGNIVGGMGIVLASQANGINAAHHAGEIQGSSGVVAPFTYIRGDGDVTDPHGLWQQTPQNHFNENSYFKDPMRGRGQPSAPSGLQNCPVPRTGINSTMGPLGPGNYYVVDNGGKPTGETVQFSGQVQFTSAGTCFNPNSPNPVVTGGWGDWVFFGGVSFPTGSQANVTFAPGRYVLAGAKGTSGNPGAVFSFGNHVVLNDQTPLDSQGQAVQNSDAGEVFIFTDTTYPGLQVPEPILTAGVDKILHFGVADLQAGANSDTLINLHGLNADPQQPGYSLVGGAGLGSFRPVIFWQDQRNSRVKYTADGNIDGDAANFPPLKPTCSLGEDGVSAPSLENPCSTSLYSANSPAMSLQATPNSHYWGAIYQPRGAWLTLIGGGNVIAPMQVVTGSLSVQGGPNVVLQGTSFPITGKKAALIE